MRAVHAVPFASTRISALLSIRQTTRHSNPRLPFHRKLYIIKMTVTADVYYSDDAPYSMYILMFDHLVNGQACHHPINWFQTMTGQYWMKHKPFRYFFYLKMENYGSKRHVTAFSLINKCIKTTAALNIKYATFDLLIYDKKVNK